MENRYVRPPRLMEKLVTFFLSDDELWEKIGDLSEGFVKKLGKKGNSEPRSGTTCRFLEFYPGLFKIQLYGV